MISGMKEYKVQINSDSIDEIIRIEMFHIACTAQEAVMRDAARHMLRYHSTDQQWHLYDKALEENHKERVENIHED